MAIVETIICVIIYWFLLFRYALTWHHWMILIAAPLVLLRTDQSIALGKSLFEDFIAPAKVTESERATAAISSLAISILVGWMISKNLPMETLKQPYPGIPISALFGGLAGVSGAIASARHEAMSVGLGFGIIGSVAGAAHGFGLSFAWVVLVTSGAILFVSAMRIEAKRDAETAPYVTLSNGKPVKLSSIKFYEETGARAALKALFGSPAIIAAGIGICIRALAIRFISTLRFLIPGLWQMGSNWRFATVVSDVFQAPELVPGVESHTYGQTYSISRKNARGEKLPQFFYIRGLLFIPIFYFPAIIWRWAIKSTAWLYLPLLWASRGWQRLDPTELSVWANSYSAKAVNWVWLAVGGLYIGVISVTLFSLEKWLTIKGDLDRFEAPATFLGFLLSLDWSQLPGQPWLWFYIPSYIMTIIVFFALDSIAKEIRNGGASLERKLAEMRFWMHVSNVRAFLTNIGIAVALVYFLRAIDVIGQIEGYLPSFL